jgi:hypothetical protein
MTLIHLFTNQTGSNWIVATCHQNDRTIFQQLLQFVVCGSASILHYANLFDENQFFNHGFK